MLALFLLGAIGVVLMFMATWQGAGLGTDSLFYINAAGNLLNGRGFSRLSGASGTKPIIHFPPLFPLLLAGLQVLGVEAVAGARLINALAFGLTVFLTGLVLRSATGKIWTSLVGACLVLASPIMIELHSWAMTEPLYLMWGLMQVFLLGVYAKNRRWLLLVASAIAAAFGYLTRYAGLSLVAAAVLALLLDTGRKPRRKLVDTLIFLGISMTPTTAWMIRNTLVGGSPTNRRLIWHPLNLNQLKLPFALLWEWLFPFPFTYAALLVMVCVLIGALAVALLLQWRRSEKSLRERLNSISWLEVRGSLMLYVLSYSGLLSLSLTFFDAWTPLDERIVSPLYISLMVLLIEAMSRLWSTIRTRSFRIIIALSAGLLLMSYVQRSVNLVSRLRTDAQGYAGKTMQAAGNLEAISTLPADLRIYSNSLAPLEFFYERGGIIIPLPGDPVTTLPVHDYLDRLAEMRRLLHEGKGVMILFFAVPDGNKLPSELVWGLELMYQGNGVSIYIGEGFERTPR